jgi:thioredoxin-related protein
MNSYRSIQGLVLSFLLLLCCFACSERSTALKDEVVDLPRAGSFSWVSTAVIYDTSSAKKPVSLMIIRRPGCIWCDTLENKTLRDSTVMGMIDTWFNACLIDGYSDSLIIVGDSLISCRDASSKVFHVAGYPTTIFFNYDGTESIRCLGYNGPGAYADLLYRAYDSLKAK